MEVSGFVLDKTELRMPVVTAFSLDKGTVQPLGTLKMTRLQMPRAMSALEDAGV
jgi:hypothetical protein